MRLTVTVPDDLAHQARQLAADTDRSVSSVVAAAIAGHVAAARRRRAGDRISAFVGTGSVAPGADAALDEIRSGSDRDAA